MYDEAPVELTDELGRLVYKQVITPSFLPRGNSLTTVLTNGCA
jgi:hypothetical protein